MAQREISLSEEPVLGQYKIVATGPSLKEEATFSVSEYVLPKFEVLLLPPAAVVRDAEQTVFKVCNVVTATSICWRVIWGKYSIKIGHQVFQIMGGGNYKHFF